MTDKPTKQKDYTSPALAGAGDYKKTIRRQMTIIKRRLARESPAPARAGDVWSFYSRQPQLGLATYSLFVSLVCLSFFLFVCLSVCPPVFSETARYTLTKLCVEVTYVVRQKPIDFGVN